MKTKIFLCVCLFILGLDLLVLHKNKSLFKITHYKEFFNVMLTPTNFISAIYLTNKIGVVQIYIDPSIYHRQMTIYLIPQ